MLESATTPPISAPQNRRSERLTPQLQSGPDTTGQLTANGTLSIVSSVVKFGAELCEVLAEQHGAELLEPRRRVRRLVRSCGRYEAGSQAVLLLYRVMPALAWSFASPSDQPHLIAFGSVRLRSWFIMSTWSG